MQLRVKVRADAFSCLDLVLRHAGLDHGAPRLEPDGASVVVDLPDATDAEHVVAVLRQHLGIVLRCVVLDGEGEARCLVHEPGDDGHRDGDPGLTADAVLARPRVR
jgi:hypothetical protein